MWTCSLMPADKAVLQRSSCASDLQGLTSNAYGVATKVNRGLNSLA